MKSVIAAAAILSAATLSAQGADRPLSIVAAQSFYGEAAAAIGGDRVAVESVAVSAEADPHDFEPPASVARQVADADMVIMNGAEYDHWMERLLDASANPDRVVIDVGALLGVDEEDNPHIWYDPTAMPALADALAAELAVLDPDAADGFASRRNDFVASLDELNQKIVSLRGRFAGMPVTATEPVFGPMAKALGLEMRNEEFQLAIMHETEPSARDIATMQEDLRNGSVKVLFYNSQVVDPLTEQLLAAAKEGGVPVVGVSESMPAGATYGGWMLDQLDATEKALAAAGS